MSLHSGSRKLAHNLDRFSLSNFEEVAGEAARLGVSVGAVRRYMDWYGDGPLTIQQVRSRVVSSTQLPAYEVRLRQDGYSCWERRIIPGLIKQGRTVHTT